jgi:electron transfer flavoprotein-quinone oxidoreductase
MEPVMSCVKWDVVVIGAGVAGAAAAYALACKGIEVLVVERGEFPGAKNMFGGVLYTSLINRLLPELASELPYEREVTRHLFYLASAGAYTLLEHSQDTDPMKPASAVTVLRSRFDRWLAGRAESAGAKIITSSVVREVHRENGLARVELDPGGTIQAKIVIVAEGVNGFLTKEAGLKQALRPSEVSLSIKETLQLKEDQIDERFQAWGGRGAACLFIGNPLTGCRGGGFLYTNCKSLSLGLVVPLDCISSDITAPDFFAGFKNAFPVSDLIRDAAAVEYAAHLIPTGGAGMMPKLVGPGMLVIGDAAGLVVNTGLRTRGADLAIASGVAAAECAAAALKGGGLDQAAIENYPQHLKTIGVIDELERYRRMPDFLKTPRLYEAYPEAACDVIGSLFEVSSEAKPRLGKLVWQTLKRRIGLWNLVADLQRLIKSS